MFAVGIVGSHELTDVQRVSARHMVWMIVDHHLAIDGLNVQFVSGGADGVDKFVEAAVRSMSWRSGQPDLMVVHEPKIKSWDAPGGFKDRNKLIAEQSDTLYCIRAVDSKTYGSFWTAKYAEELGKKVYRYYV